MKIGLGILLGDKAAKYSGKFRYKATGWIANKTLKTDKCPLCGGALVERESRFGKFIACSNFPKCRYKCNA
jgi:ssDNA-binding Zn-finger/Zn-ribbon topoisomerase 1